MDEQMIAAEKSQYREPPAKPDPLVKTWQDRVAAAKRRWEKFHKRVAHNRKLVAGFDWSKDPDAADFYTHRANLIHGTITAILPNIYARNPELSVIPQHQGRDLKLLCKTIERVTNRQLEDARLKKRAKAAVRAALTCSFGAVKVMYQRNLKEDPFIKARIQDTQDNIARLEALILKVEDDSERCDHEAAKRELEETLAGLNEKAEVVAGEGLCMDRVLTEHILLDPSLAEFEDYPDSDWMIQMIPMKKSTAEGLYGFKLDNATAYKEPGSEKPASGKVFSGDNSSNGDCQICILEIWDRQSQRVFTTAEGLDFWLKDPFTPGAVGERWFPYFLLPFQLVDGTVIAPSLVDLTEKLQTEHNDAREKEKAHRDMIKPGYVADKGEVKQKDLVTFTDAVLGEVTLLDAGGKPLNQVIQPKQHPPLDPAVYDTSKVRYDWEQVTGMQDAARSSVVSRKTATEASIMQQSLSGRVSEFRDQVEDFLQEISNYAAQILLQELTAPQVERIMGPHKTGPLTNPDGTPAIDPATLQPVVGVIEPAYDWPQLSREEVFDLVQLLIRSGTTGEPDKMDQQEIMIKLMPVIQPLIVQIMQMQMQAIDTTSLETLLREVVSRFDDKLDLDQIIPKLKPMPAPTTAGGMPA